MIDPLGLASQSGIRPSATPPPQTQGADGKSFQDVLMKNIEQVNELQQDATKAIEDLQTGERTDPEGVLMATAKADMAFQLLQQVRNKVVSAYQEMQQFRV